MSIKIALIEDNTDMRENIREILELADYAVFTAENGKRGVEIIKSELPDLILCDIMMPELDGYGVLHIISNNPKTAKIPFIFLTAKTERDDFRKGMNMGADDYLTKPFDDTQLLDAIERRLKRIELFSNEFPPNEAGLTDFFNNVSGLKELEQLKESRHTKKYNKKDSIYSESYYPSFLYFINSGKVRTSKMNMDGKDFVTGLFKEGEFFGFMEMIRETNYEESAFTMENTELTLIPREDFLKLLFTSKEVSGQFIKMLSGSVTVKQEELLNLAYDTVRKRVASSLLKLVDKYNQDESSDFSMSISRNELAAMVGTSTESVIRTLSEFKADGYISVQGSTITILQQDELRNFRF
ncbi:MAG: response regulator [Halobacteriovoraceae bacterium]|jgi:CRP-like cAMP-binding protein/ActR/RegA family two-component response regulator|nr:response regulator [Halobacteriovoraceae bacterium]